MRNVLGMTLNCPPNEESTMYPPAHVCRALHSKFPDLRLAWHGSWGKFVLVRLSPKHMTMKHSALMTMMDTLWFTKESINQDTGRVETVRDTKGPVFSKDGVNNPDWDMLTTDVIMVTTIDDPSLVFSGKLVHDLVYETRQEIRRRHAKGEHEKGKHLKAKIADAQASTADKISYYVNRHDGITVNTAKKHLLQEEIETEKARPDTPDIEYYHVEKRGLKEYL